MTKVFGRVKSKLEETKIWLKRKEKRKSAVANEILEIKSREIKNQESLPDFLVRMIEMESTLKTKLPYYGSEGEEEDLSSSPIKY